MLHSRGGAGRCFPLLINVGHRLSDPQAHIIVPQDLATKYSCLASMHRQRPGAGEWGSFQIVSAPKFLQGPQISVREHQLQACPAAAPAGSEDLPMILRSEGSLHMLALQGKPQPLRLRNR